MAARYYVGPGGGAWNLNANWSNISGGAGGFSFPVAGDNAFLDAGSAGNGPTLTVAAACDQLDCTGFTGTFDLAGFTLSIHTTLFLLVPGMIFTHNNGMVDFLLNVPGVVAITCGGQTLGHARFGNAGAGGTFQQQDAMVVDLDHDCVAGTYQTNNAALNVNRDMLWRSTMAANGFQAGASIVTVGRTLDYVVSNTLQYGTSSFRFVGTGLIQNTVIAVRHIRFYDLYVADPGQVTTLNIAGSSTCTVYNTMMTGSGTFTRTNGVFTIDANTLGAAANSFQPNALCAWEVPFTWEGNSAAGVYMQVPPANYRVAGNVVFRVLNAFNANGWVLQNDVTIGVSGIFSVSIQAMAAGVIKSFSLNGFNLAVNQVGVVGGNFDSGVFGGGYGLSPTFLFGPNTMTVAGYCTIDGMGAGVTTPTLLDLRGGGSLVVVGNFTFNGIGNADQYIEMDGNCLVSVGGNWNSAVGALLFRPVYPGINNILRFTAGPGVITIALDVTQTLPRVEFTGGCTCALPNGFRCQDLIITAGFITAGNPLIVLSSINNAGTFTASVDTTVGSSFINTGTFVGAGSNITVTGFTATISGFNPVSLTMGPTCLRLQLAASMNIGTFIIQDRLLPGVVQYLAGGTFNIGTMNSQVVSSDGIIQFVSSVAGTRYTWNVTAAITSVAQVWPRDNDASGSAIVPTGDITNKDLGNNLGWTLGPVAAASAILRVISEDAGQDLLAAGGIGPIQYCWLVDTAVAGLTAQAAAFAAGANNWHRKTNIPFSALDNLVKGTTYFVGLGLVDDRNRRLAPNIGAGDYATGIALTPESGTGGGGGFLHVQSLIAAGT